MEPDENHPKLIPLPADELEAFIIVGSHGCLAKNLQRNHTTNSASSLTLAMDIGPLQGQPGALGVALTSSTIDHTPPVLPTE